MPERASSHSPPLIAHVIFRLQAGGLENGVVNLVNRMREMRHAVICLSDADTFRQRIHRDDVAIYELHKRPGQDFALWFRLYRLFRQLRPSIVHTRNIGCLEAQIAARMAGVRCRVHGEQGWELSDRDGRNARYRLWRKLLAPLVQRFVVLTAELQAYLRDQVGIAPNRIVQIDNGVDTTRFAPRHSSALPAEFASSDSIVIGTVGRLDPVKDQTTLCRAFVQLCTTLPPQRASTLRLVIVGDGILRDACIDVLRVGGVERQAWLAGTRDEIPQLLNALDIFVLPSVAEGMSNTVLEAMACALPVVATRVGGNPALLGADECGLMVPVQDPQAMAAALIRYLHDPLLRSRHGHNARQRVESLFGLERMLDGYRTLYQQLIASHGGQD